MTSRSLPKVLHARKSTSLEVERENFEKAQAICINKAINQQEIPVKEKHVRSAIIGTFSDQGAGFFWNVVVKLPLQENPIICWKFLHVLHKLLREGHQNVIADSQRYRKTLIDLGKLWGHLKEGYGKLIFHHSKLLLVKLDFHKKNPGFPNNLAVNDEQLGSIGEHDVNNYFQLTVEMFDYMDEILQLQTAVFGSLDMSRSNSMTSSGQCRLASLIPCIQDSTHLYDFCVKLLFKMHSSLPPDLLVGHRDRFLKQFKILKRFYISSSNLQYFKYLIQIPLLPDDPPNFFVASDLSSHVSPVVILPPQIDTPERDVDTIDMNLVDTSSTISSSPTRFDDSDFSSEHRNGTSGVDERDKLIEELKREIVCLQIEIHKQAAENQQIQCDLRLQLESLKNELEQLKASYQTKCVQNSELLKKTEENRSNTHAVVLLAESENKVKVSEDKFSKMKDVYSKLREEHISLLRNKADVDKKLSTHQKKETDSSQSQQDLQQRLEYLEKERSEMENKLVQFDNISIQINELSSEKMRLNQLQEESISKLNTVHSEKDSLKENISSLNKQKDDLEGRLLKIESENQNLLQKERSNSFMKQLDILAGIIDEASSVVKGTIEEMDNPLFTTNTCPPELFLQQSSPVLSSLEKLSSGHDRFLSDEDDIEGLTNSIGSFSHVISHYILQGKAASNMSPDIEMGDEIASMCRNIGDDTLNLFSAIRNKDTSDKVTNNIEILRTRIKNVVGKTEGLISKMSKNQADNIGEMLNEEISSMDKAIEEAAKRIAEMLDKSREADSGIKLEVNKKILDACNGLMQAIRVLVTSSKHLQKEIVDQGRGSATATEFYKRNHRWSEGFLSAAKEIGIGAKFLVNAADKVMKGESKFEELVVASNEIAAGTAQLVIASKVKADRDSAALVKLSSASKGLTGATANVVATAKSCADLIEESDTMDFGKFSLHQAKLHEMESQVRVLELESSLVKERSKLASLRKRHYQLAGPSEGWETTDK